MISGGSLDSPAVVRRYSTTGDAQSDISNTCFGPGYWVKQQVKIKKLEWSWDQNLKMSLLDKD